MKKYLLAFAVLAMSMAVFTACGNDDEEDLPQPIITANYSESDLTVMEGETLVIEPQYQNVDEKTTYEWTWLEAVISTEPKLSYIFYTYGTYPIRLKVTTKAGTAQMDFRVTVTEKVLTVDFEGEYWNKLIDSPQYGGTLLYGENAKNYTWTDEATGLTGGITPYDPWGYGISYSGGGTAISNYIDENLQEHNTYEYQLAIPFKNNGQNFAVVYCNSDTEAPAEGIPSISFKGGAKHIIASIDICPTTYTLGVVKYGNQYAQSLAEEGDLVLTITADNDPEKTQRVRLARNGVLLERWLTVKFPWSDPINSLSFTMDGSDKSGSYMNTPTYFALDNIRVKP